MQVYKYGAKIGLAVVAILAGSLTVAGPANAASSPIAVCGGGSYHEIDHIDLPGARVHLLYDGSTDCVVTWRNTPGARAEMSASIAKAPFTHWIKDSGNYTTYAGPVKVTAPGVCINWGGSFDGYGEGAGASHCR